MSRAMTQRQDDGAARRGRATRHPAAQAAGPEALDRGDAHEHDEDHRQDTDGPAADVPDGAGDVRRFLRFEVMVGHDLPMCGIRRLGCTSRRCLPAPRPKYLALRPMGPRTGARAMTYGRGTSRSRVLTQTARPRRRPPPCGRACARAVVGRARCRRSSSPVLGASPAADNGNLIDTRSRLAGSGTTVDDFTFSRHVPGQPGETPTRSGRRRRRRIDAAPGSRSATGHARRPGRPSTCVEHPASAGTHTYVVPGRAGLGGAWCALTARAPGDARSPVHADADAQAHPEADAEADPEADAEADPEADRAAHPDAHAEAEEGGPGGREPDAQAQADPDPHGRRRALAVTERVARNGGGRIRPRRRPPSTRTSVAGPSAIAGRRRGRHGRRR